MKKTIEYTNDTEYLDILRTLIREKSRKLGGPFDAYNAFRKYALESQEHFLVATLNGAHEIVDTFVITIGLMNRTVVHPREVYRKAIQDNACAIIVGHNHPSGNLEPSPEDLDITRRLQSAGQLLGIPMLDHLIIGPQGYRSMIESGDIKQS